MSINKLHDAVNEASRIAISLLAGDFGELNDFQRESVEKIHQASISLASDLTEVAQLIEQSNFVAIISMGHQLRSYIANVQAYGLLFVHESLSQPYLVEHFQKIGDLGTDSIIAINNILTWARIKAGYFKRFNDDVFDLWAMTCYSLFSNRQMLSKTHLQVTLQVEDDLPTIFGDGLRIRESVHHLLENAMKFTTQGNIHINIKAVDRTLLELKVRDTGIGIAPEHLEHIFEPFYQVDEQTSGLGLGLFIAKSTAELYNAALHCESIVGVGTTFYLRIPVR